MKNNQSLPDEVIATPASNLTFNRDAELDGLRGLAVSMVLAWHFIGIPAWSTEGWLSHALFRVLLLGGAGVDLFFVLSGFLITRIIISRHHSSGRFLLSFYTRRALRILPPYLLLISVFVVAVWTLGHNNVFNEDIPLWRLLTFTQNFWMAENGGYGPEGISVTWSVAIEEQYYLAFPLLAVLMPKRLLPVFLMVIVVASIAWRAEVFMQDPTNSFPAYLGTFARLDGLAAGGLAACALNNLWFNKWLRLHMCKLQRAMILCLALLVIVRRDSGVQMAYFGHTMLTVCFTLVITYIMLNLGSNKKGMQFLRSEPLRFFGKVSYSLYLFHPMILSSGFLITGYSKSLSGLPQVFLLMVCFILSVILSWILFNHFEKPLLNFGKSITY